MSKYCPLDKTMKIFIKDGSLADLFRFNEFSEDIEFRKKPCCTLSQEGDVLADQDITQLRYYVTATHSFEPPKQIIADACFLRSINYNYHPVKDYIESIKWDNIPRCDEWLIKTVNCEDNYYTRMASSKFLIACVSRIYNPGCKFDHMLILEGEQGIGKSTLVEELAGQWYLDTNFGHKDKDLIDSMRGVFIIEISELSGMNKKDVDWLKSFLSKKVDRVRLPYAARSKDFKRKCVFIGTYNPSGNNMYLRDDTGNRRFWPIECGSFIDISYLKNNKNQLWAEALIRYRNGEKYYIDNEKALNILSGLHGDRELESPTHIKIEEWINPGMGEVCMNDIIEKCLKINTDGKLPKDLLSVQTIIGIIMRKLKWKKGTNENRDKYYPPE